jgi:hypothetical protein
VPRGASQPAQFLLPDIARFPWRLAANGLLSVAKIHKYEDFGPAILITT